MQLDRPEGWFVLYAAAAPAAGENKVKAKNIMSSIN
jgi:hypothetical protein